MQFTDDRGESLSKIYGLIGPLDMETHSSSPWTVSKFAKVKIKIVDVEKNSREEICTIGVDKPASEVEKNIALICSAPEMLEKLKEVRKLFELENVVAGIDLLSRDLEVFLNDIDKLIAKAEDRV